MKIRITAIIFSVAMLAVLLSGCACQHEWVEATCLTPKICNLCQETEGEALGHTWAEVTCAAPKTCTACGETEGEALPHTWVEANYQNPKTCTECGATEGEPLPADFEKYGIITFMEKGVPYEYITTCHENERLKTEGLLTILDHYIVESDNEHLEKQGYEWHVVEYEQQFFDENAWKYGAKIFIDETNYYDIKNWEATGYEVGDKEFRYTISYNGKRCTCEVTYDQWIGGWKDQVLTLTSKCHVHVPNGYDGVVLAFLDAGIEHTDDSYIYDIMDENTLFFRLD